MHIDEMVAMVMQDIYESNQKGMLPMWTIYDHPLDWPKGYMARKHEVGNGTIRATSRMIGGTDDSLPSLRRVFTEAGLTCMTRAVEDDPKIVEVWL